MNPEERPKNPREELVLRLLRNTRTRRLSDYEIARRCKVGKSMVSRLRREYGCTVDECVVIRNGATYKMDVSGIRAAKRVLPSKRKKPSPQLFKKEHLTDCDNCGTTQWREGRYCQKCGGRLTRHNPGREVG